MPYFLPSGSGGVRVAWPLMSPPAAVAKRLGADGLDRPIYNPNLCASADR